MDVARLRSWPQELNHFGTARGVSDIARIKSWRQRDLKQSAEIYEALLRADIFKPVLHGLRSADTTTIAKRANTASRVFWRLLDRS
jgi:hypothetical protein